MRKTKIIIAISVIVLLLGGAIFSIIYFTKKDNNAKVVTTIFPIYDIAREIMGSSDDLLLLENNGSDMHSYQPTAGDITTISKCELFIYVGGESDNWVSGVIASANNINLKTLELINHVEKLEENHDNILNDEEHNHNEEVTYDEHIWLSLKNMIKMTESIRDSLCLVYPEKQELFKVNAENYINKLEDLESKYSNELLNKEKTLIIADRFPFRYLVNDYNLNYYAVFSGCSAESEASTETIATLIDKINENNINYVLVLETSDKSIANRAITDTKCKEGVGVLVINSCQSVNVKDLDNISYLEIMEQNLVNLKKAIA